MAPPGRPGHRDGHLPARRHRKRAIRRRRRRTQGRERLLPGAYPDWGRTEPALAVRRQCRAAPYCAEGITPMQVTRHRKRTEKQGLLNRRGDRRGRVAKLTAITFAVAAAGSGIGFADTQQFGTDQVGQLTDQGLVVSSDQYINPIGNRLVINNGKIMSSSISPDGTHIAASVTDGGMALAIVDLKSWKVQQLIGNNASANLRISGNDVGQEGPTYSPDGKSLWLGQTDGYRKFAVNADGSLANPTFVPIPASGPMHSLAAAAVFSPDGSTVYSAVNGQNRVVAINAATRSEEHTSELQS